MSSATTDGAEHHTEKLAHLFHELVDRVAHSTEYDRLALHDLVAECFGGVTKNQAADAVADPTAYAEAREAGAYDAPEPAQQSLTPDQVRIQQLTAELDAMRSGVPNTPPEQSPATSTAPPFSAAPGPGAAAASTAAGQPPSVWGNTGAPPVTGAADGPPEPVDGASADTTTTDGSAPVTADVNATGTS